MNRFLVTMSGILVISLVSFCEASIPLSSRGASKTLPLDRIVAVVNQEVIAQSELDHQVFLLKKQLGKGQVQGLNDKAFKQQVLQSLIDRKLQVQLAKKLDIQVSDAEVNQALRRLAEQNQISWPQFFDFIRQEGWTPPLFRKEIHDELMIQKLQEQEVARRMNITDQDIHDFIKARHHTQSDRYQVMDVLIPLSETPSQAEIHRVQKEAEQIRTRLAAKDPSIKKTDLGVRKLEDFPPVFSEQIAKMSVGEISHPVRTPNGFHLLQLVQIQSPFSSINMVMEYEPQLIFLQKDSQKKIESVVKALHQKDDFGVIAQKYSDDKSTASSQGYLGWVRLTALPPIIQKNVEELNVGSVSDLIMTPEGTYIVKLLNKREIPVMSDQERKQIQHLVFQYKIDEEIQTFIKALRQGAYIKVMEEFSGMKENRE